MENRNTEKVGWRISEWCPAVGVGRSHAYNLISAGEIKVAKSGSATIIVTSPREYIDRLAAAEVAKR